MKVRASVRHGIRPTRYTQTNSGMFQRIWSLIIKELLASARDPQTRWVVLFSPPFLLVIYAFAITQEISSVTLGVYTQDRGVEARELISRFEGSPTFEEILYLRRDADIADIMGRATAVLEDWVREHPEQWFWVHRRWPD